ncbi:MAG TPA: GNAT family N-acetyltransferase [Gaiellaceae bacterium]|jgi:GNAT superfamily N-acetyltransferase
MAPVPGLMLALEPADSETSLELQQAFFAEIRSRYPEWEPAASGPAEPADLAPPHGAWLVAHLDGRPVGCGGLKRLDDDIVEVRRVFIARTARGLGIGRLLLQELEERARGLGYRRVRLTTGDSQPEALGLFQAAGYREVPRFNDNRFTRHWMEKAL